MTVNIALLGTGSIAANALAPAINNAAGARLWSVLSRDSARARAFAEQFGAKTAYTSLTALLADSDLDAVVIATPDKLHAEQTLAAAAAGKHVFVEKPLATDRRQAAAMVDACERSGVRLGVAYHLRWHQGHRQVAALLARNTLGSLRHMRAQWTFRAPDAGNWRAAATVGRWWSLAGVGTHCLDLIRWWMVPGCGEVVDLSSTISRSVWGGPHDETAIVTLRFESGATAEFCSSVLFQAPSRAEIYGSEGYILCHDTLSRFGGGQIDSHAGEIDFVVKNPYLGEIEDFVAAIRDERPPMVDGREGLRNVELLLAAC